MISSWSAFLIEVRAGGRLKSPHVGDGGLRSTCPSVSSGCRYERITSGLRSRRQGVHEEPDALLIVPHDRASEGSTRLCQAPLAQHPRTDGHTLRRFINVEVSLLLVLSRPSRMRLSPNRNSLL